MIPKIPTPKSIGADAISSTYYKGMLAAYFKDNLRANIGVRKLRHLGFKVDNIFEISNGRIMVIFRLDDKKIQSNQKIKAEHADVFIHNPRGVLIYGRVNRIIATKIQKHVCDAECKRHGHRYFHDFTSKPKMYGLPNGDLLITTR